MSRARAPVTTPAEFRALGDGRFAVAGSVGFGNAGALLAQGEATLAGIPAAEIDLSGVTHADSAALAVLLEWVAGARRRRATLRYVGVPETLDAMARISEVEPLLRSAETAGTPGPAAA